MQPAPDAWLPKATSVTTSGEPDGWTPPRGFTASIAPDRRTRLVVHVPPEALRDTHLQLIRALGGPLGVQYVRLTDRRTGRQLPAPERFLAMGLDARKVLAALEARPGLIWQDGRHQLWIRGPYGEQLVLDELGLLYCYPDDPIFRDALGDLPEISTPGMDTRDYVRVNFLASADAEELSLMHELSLQAYGSGV